MSSFEELCSAILSPEHDAVEITRRALLCSRERTVAFDLAQSNDEATRAGSTLLRDLLHILTVQPLSLDLSDQAREELGEAVRSVGSAGGTDRDGLEAISAHTLALALEEVFGTRFFFHLAALGERFLGENDLLIQSSPFVEKYSPFRSAYRKRLTPDPYNLGARGADRLRSRGRLMPNVPHGAQLRWIPSWTALDDLRPGSLITIVIPGQYEDLAPPTQESRAERRWFFGVWPKDPAACAETAMRIVQDADAAGAQIVVLPEVCLTREGVDGLADWIEQKANHILVAVCGSCHEESAGVRRNVAYIASSSKAPEYNRVAQAKIVPYVRRTDGVEYIEDIRCSEPEICLLSGREWSLLTLICMDFVDDRLATLAQNLRPTLVLVPACTETTGVFATTAQQLSVRAQAHVVIANQNVSIDGGTKAAVAMISRPLREHPAVTIDDSDGSVEIPGIRTTRLATGEWTKSLSDP